MPGKGVIHYFFVSVKNRKRKPFMCKNRETGKNQEPWKTLQILRSSNVECKRTRKMVE
jgi:hypothetical protein